MDQFQKFCVLRTYFEIGILLFAGFCGYVGLIWLFTRLKIQLNYAKWIRVGYFLQISSVLLPIVLISLPKATLLKPAAQVWSSSRSSDQPNASQYLTFSGSTSGLSEEMIQSAFVVTEYGLSIVLIWIGLVVLTLSSNFLRKVFKLQRELRTLPIIKKIGKVIIVASQEHSIGFSTWSPSRALVAIPFSSLENRSDYRMTVSHELQHHRNGDTRWLYLTEVLKILFFWNPGIYGFDKKLSHFQEFACDEYLIGHRKLSPQAYGSCLLRAAESAIGLQSRLVGTAGMAAINDPSLLKRRIIMILSKKKKQPEKVATFFLMIGLITWMSTIAYAAKSTLQDRKLSYEEASKYVSSSQPGSKIPIDLNDLVLKKLNDLIGTPQGRKRIQEGLAKMPQYQVMIENKLKANELPLELIAIPFFETAFDNSKPEPPQKGAGIWAFIPETARHYDLEVTDQKDDRYNEILETDAAIKYLKKLHGQFQDWRLAIKAYNEGETQVEKLIQELKTKDPWVLERKSSSEQYLSGVIATMIILSHPELQK